MCCNLFFFQRHFVEIMVRFRMKKANKMGNKTIQTKKERLLFKCHELIPCQSLSHCHTVNFVTNITQQLCFEPIKFGGEAISQKYY